MTSSVCAPATTIGRTPLDQVWILVGSDRSFGSLGLQLYGRLADMPLSHRHYQSAQHPCLKRGVGGPITTDRGQTAGPHETDLIACTDITFAFRSNEGITI